MTKSKFNYDEMSDTLYVSFEPGTKATGIELLRQFQLRCYNQCLYLLHEML